MKIDPSALHAVSQPPERVAERKPPAQAERPESSRRPDDKAQVTLDGEKLRQLKVELDRVPEIRQERVDALRRALVEGRYRIDEHQVAEAVWADLLEPARPGE
jgi:flagellar biosynthesis anti-sigma factor FlgM